MSNLVSYSRVQHILSEFSINRACLDCQKIRVDASDL